MTASAFGFNVFEYFREVIGLSAGEKVDKGTVTLINRGEAKEYDSIEELLEAENINILYPSVLPEGIAVKSIRILENGDGKQIILLTNNPQTTVSIYTNKASTGDSFGDCEVYLSNDITFYVNRELNSAYFIFENDYYSIQAETYENIIFIIDSLKRK